MFTFTNIPNMDAFLKVVEESRGQVQLHLPNQSVCELKGSDLSQQISRSLRSAGVPLRISLSDPQDTPSFLRYMMEAGRVA